MLIAGQGIAETEHDMRMGTRVFLHQFLHQAVRLGTTWAVVLLYAAGLNHAAHAQTAGGDPANEKPNFVLIVADGLGYGDLGCYGCPDISTPHLDRMAREGVLLTDCYANGSTSTPTRAALMTGRYPQRIGLELSIPDGASGPGLPPKEWSIARMLGTAGYQTAMSGQWHLGYHPQQGPNHHGFSQFFGMLGKSHHYFQHYDGSGRPDLFIGTTPAKTRGYATDLISHHAVEFLEAMDDAPFFLYVAFNAPHAPYLSPDDSDRTVTPQADWTTGTRATYVDMVECLDAGVGRILKALSRRGLDQRTLVVFTSSHGGSSVARNEPLMKGEGTLWEGGVRVPCLARWTGRIPGGTRSSQIAMIMDWAATIVTLAGSTPPVDRPFDGINLLPIIVGRPRHQPRTIYWRQPPDPNSLDVVPARAVRSGDWKYIDEPDGSCWLFDLARDRGESNNLADKQPGRTDRMRRALDDWENNIDPPLYRQSYDR